MAKFQVPVLGRKVYLGMLYDRYKDTPLYNHQALFNRATLRRIRPQQIERTPSSPFAILIKDDLQEKFQHLEMDQSYQLSFFGGFIEVKGAAEYVHDRKSSGKEVQVALKYTYKVDSEELPTEKLKEVDYPDVLRTTDATHMISKITYGCDIYLVFIQSIDIGEKLDDVKAKVAIHARAIHSLLEQSTSDKILSSPDSEKITCKCFCDVDLSHTTIRSSYSDTSQSNTFLLSYSEVAKTCKNIFEIVKRARVPKLVTLHPLPGRSRRLIEEVSTSITKRIEGLLNKLLEAKEKCNHLKRREICRTFEHLENDMEELVNQMDQFKSEFQNKLQKLIPDARKIKAHEAKLEEAVNEYETSPFLQILEEYIELKNEEAKQLEIYIQQLMEEPVQKTSRTDFEQVTHNEEHCYMFLFSFNIAQGTVPSYEGSRPSGEWEQHMDEIKALKKHIDTFLKFVKANKGRSNTAFAFSPKLPTTLNYPTVELYIRGNLSKTGFTIPTAPNILHCTSAGTTSVDLTWTTSEYSEQPDHYIIYYRKAASSEQWINIETTNNNGNIQNLTANTEYNFSVCTVFPSCYSPTSLTVSVKTDSSSSSTIS